MLPENLQGWYDGQTQVTLPSGRIITPPARTYLKYNPDAFAGRVVKTPNGATVADQFWYGNADITYDEIRTDSRFNVDMSIRREFTLPNALRLEVGADAMNILNNTQFSGSYIGALGNTVTNRESGARPGSRNGQLEQLWHPRDEHLQSAATHAARHAALLSTSGRGRCVDGRERPDLSPSFHNPALLPTSAQGLIISRESVGNVRAGGARYVHRRRHRNQGATRSPHSVSALRSSTRTISSWGDDADHAAGWPRVHRRRHRRPPNASRVEDRPPGSRCARNSSSRRRGVFTRRATTSAPRTLSSRPGAPVPSAPASASSHSL